MTGINFRRSNPLPPFLPLLFIFYFLATTTTGMAQDDLLARPEGPFIVHEITIDPDHTETLYAVTSNYGVLKTTDGGEHWGFANHGLKTYTHRALLLDPTDPKTIYIGGWGGGVSKSVDGGMEWVDYNGDLDNTAINAMAIDPDIPEGLFAATMIGIYRSTNGGLAWRTFGGGILPHDLETARCLVASPISPRLYLCTDSGLYFTDRAHPAWQRVVAAPLRGKSVSAVTIAPRHRLIYVATLEGELFKSGDRGGSWTALGTALKGIWIRKIAVSPEDEKTLYVATSGKGVWKSIDGGRTWKASSDGLTDSEVRSLVIHPKNPQVLYAGTQDQGVFRSDDGGTTWRRQTHVPVVTVHEVVASLDRGLAGEPVGQHEGRSEVPGVFSKCNQCHGWGDPQLNQKATYWRMPVNRRNWAQTVKRMAPKAGLTPEEEALITEFLDRYTRQKATGKNSSQLVRQKCGRCHSLRIKKECVAGDCQKQKERVQTGPRQWDRVVDWMQMMGAGLTAHELKTAVDYLSAVFPQKEYPLAWVKLPAMLGEGGWNIVTLKNLGDSLYAGVEGNGRLYRSKDGIHWELGVETGQYSVYALTEFHNQLYIGTHYPLPQIWKSKDGEQWSLASVLPEEEKGVFSLGEFDGALYAGTGRGRIYRSTDGAAWKPVGNLKKATEASFPHWVRFLMPFEGHVYAGLEKGPLYRSADGSHWAEVSSVSTGQFGTRGAAIFGSALYIGTTGGGAIWRTKDGTAWERVFTAPPHLPHGYVAAMAVAAGRLYASVDGYVFRTQNGRKWEEVGNLGPHTIEALAALSDELYAGTLIPPRTRIYRAFVSQDIP
jgi:photosystem II stability/assembly factor-like uncharacterized protein